MLDTAHMQAAPTVSKKPASVMALSPSPWALPMATSPPSDTTRPSQCHRRAGSPSRKAASSSVTKACVCSTTEDRKSTRLNSSHLVISYAVFCLKKKKNVVHGQFAHEAYLCAVPAPLNWTLSH